VPYIFEVNSGPGLEATSFDKYVEAFKLAIDNKKTSTTVTAPFSEKNTMKKQLAELQEMVDKSEDSDELAKVREIGAKLIFGGQ
jgi:hypothetical protein